MHSKMAAYNKKDKFPLMSLAFQDGSHKIYKEAWSRMVIN